jgi:dTDP-4-amino-4,6-dideoxygalactose transaminase
MGICNLRHIDEEIGKRKRVYERYLENLKDVEGIKLPYIQENITPNYAYFPVVFFGKYNRDGVYEKLKGHDIIARKYFYPLTNDYECYKDLDTADSSLTPFAKYVADHVLTLPIYSDLSPEDVDRICDMVLESGNN